jgi:hypothetical protein
VSLADYQFMTQLLGLARKVKKLSLLEFTGGCRMNGQFTKVRLNLT